MQYLKRRYFILFQGDMMRYEVLPYENIRNLRVDAGMTQQQVADDLGKSVQDIAFLHIGDNEDVDIMPAKLHDMEGFHIHSAIDMLELTNAFTKLTGQRKISEMTLDERLFIGLFISKMFNSPFSLHNSVGKLQINSPEILGYSLVAPMLTAFMLWLKYGQQMPIPCSKQFCLTVLLAV